MRRIMKLLSETLLTLAALGGVACIVLVVLAFAGGYSLIMFKTGSMHPTIPAGSVALVQQIPASDVEVGDILTVDRENALPVTHRVAGIEAGPTADARTITMRGDANDADDPFPYDITSARVTIGSVPHLAHVIAWFGNPWIMAGITLGAASLVTWAFWPRDRDDDDGAPEDDGGSHSSQAPRGRHAEASPGRVVAIGVLAAGILLSALAPGAEAQAADEAPSVFTITTNLDPTKSYELHEQATLFWDIKIDALAAPTRGRLDVAMSGDGGDHLRVLADVSVCSVPWQSAGCVGTEREISSSPLFVNRADWQQVLTADVPDKVHLRLALTAGRTTGSPEGATATVTVRATAEETVEEVRLEGSPELAGTGASPSWFTLTLAPLAIGAGLAVALFARKRYPNRSSEPQHQVVSRE